MGDSALIVEVLRKRIYQGQGTSVWGSAGGR